ncbi:MAG: hypothetical protein WC608_01680 [Parcubacteria group bacterium]
MTADLFEIRETKNRGNGLFAKEFIPKGTLISFWCEKCKTFSKNQFNLLSETEKGYILEFGHAFNEKEIHIVTVANI